MAQIFIERRENTIGMAILSMNRYKEIHLISLYPSAGESIEDFPAYLKRVVDDQRINQIWVSPLAEGEGRLGELEEFRSLDDVAVSISEVKKTVKPMSALMARKSLLSARKLDESTFYDQTKKLIDRLSRLSGNIDTPADLQAYLAGLALIHPDIDLDEREALLCSFAPTYDDFGDGGRTTDLAWGNFSQVG